MVILRGHKLLLLSIALHYKAAARNEARGVATPSYLKA